MDSKQILESLLARGSSARRAAVCERRCFTVEQIRELIRVSPSETNELRETFGIGVSTRAVIYRRLVMLHFNTLVVRWNGEEKKEDRAA